MNEIFTSSYEYDHLHALRRAEYALLEKILLDKGLDKDTYAYLEPECKPTEFEHVARRKAQWVCYFISALNAGADQATLPDLSSCGVVDVTGVNIP